MLLLVPIHVEIDRCESFDEKIGLEFFLVTVRLSHMTWFDEMILNLSRNVLSSMK